MALFTRTAKFDPGAHGARCAWAMAIQHAVGISCQRNSGYRPSRVNIMAQSLSTPDPSLRSPIPTSYLSIRRGHATTIHYTHHQVSLMVLHNTTLVPSLGLHIGPTSELSTSMWRERVSPQIRKKERHLTAVIDCIYYIGCILKTNNETVYSTWNDLQRSLKVINNVILLLITLTFYQETGKVGYINFQTQTTEMTL